jgi:single-strand DNA-binding protein
MARSLNKVLLIGNLTRDPELRYTPQGTAVCSFGLATNRQWVTESGEKKEDVEFHRLVAWNKLAEICAQLLKKGRKVFIEGRLQTRTWAAQDGSQRSATEVVVSDMVLLDQKREGESLEDFDVPANENNLASSNIEEPVATEEGKEEKKQKDNQKEADSLSDEDIPF